MNNYVGLINIESFNLYSYLIVLSNVYSTYSYHKQHCYQTANKTHFSIFITTEAIYIR